MASEDLTLMALLKEWMDSSAKPSRQEREALINWLRDYSDGLEPNETKETVAVRRIGSALIGLSVEETGRVIKCCAILCDVPAAIPSTLPAKPPTNFSWQGRRATRRKRHCRTCDSIEHDSRKCPDKSVEIDVGDL